MIEIIVTLLFSSFNLGALGTIVLWQRIVNIGDSLSHAIIFSFVIEYFFKLPQALGCVIVAVGFTICARFLSKTSSGQNLSMIVLSSMAIALTFLVSDLSGGDFKIKDFIVGDILSCGRDEMYISIAVSILVIFFLYFKFREIVLFSISEDIAKVNAVNVKNLKIYISIILALAIAVFIQVIGALLMTAFLVIPASIARIVSQSPQKMLCLSILISLISSLVSFIISMNYDISFSACSIILLSVIYIVTNIRQHIIE